MEAHLPFWVFWLFSLPDFRSVWLAWISFSCLAAVLSAQYSFSAFSAALPPSVQLFLDLMDEYSVTSLVANSMNVLIALWESVG